VEVARKCHQGCWNETWGSQKLRRGSDGIDANPIGGCYGSLSGASLEFAAGKVGVVRVTSQ
jgi:hypothetical protein